MILRNYLLISLRNLFKNKIFVGINVFGMGIAIACSMVAYLSFVNHAGFDSMHTHVADVYRVGAIREAAGKEEQYASVPVALGHMIRENAGDVKNIIRFSTSFSKIRSNNDYFDASLAYVDPAAFSIFSFEFIAGKPGALSNRAAIFLSESMSVKLFGTTDALGKTVQQQLSSGDVVDYEVAAIYKDQPFNSSFQRNAFVNYDNYNREFPVGSGFWSSYNNLFVQLERADRIEALTAQLQAFATPANETNAKSKTIRFYLEPFEGMARRDAAGDTFGTYTSGATPLAIILTLVVMSLLILAIACFNLTNTLVAISARRLKEIGLRKVMGSVRLQLMAQFIGESVLICFFAVLLGLAFSDILLQAWNTMWPFLKLEMAIGEHPHIIVFLVVLALVTGGVSGFYPAVYISRFEPAQILKGKVDFGGTSYFTRALLVLQFAFSVLALFFSIAFYQNSVYQKNFNFGFAHKELLVLPLDQPRDYDKLRNDLAQQPDIVSVTGSVDNLFSSRTHAPVTINNLDIEADILSVGEGYRKTMGFTLAEGRDFNPASENDRAGSVIISRNLAESAGLENALDKTILLNDSTKVFVVGVIDDVYSYGTWHARQPLILRYTAEATYKQMIIRTAGDKLPAVNDAAKQVWAKLYPGKPYAGETMNSLMNVSEDISRNVLIIFTFLAAVALLLSIAGLYSTVSLNLARRTKEIGVRKVFGASVRQILWVTNIQFVVILVLSSVAGCLVGASLVGFMMRLLWAYYQAANVMTFVMTTTGVLLLAGVMIGAKVYKAAQANPVVSLREE